MIDNYNLKTLLIERAKQKGRFIIIIDEVYFLVFDRDLTFCLRSGNAKVSSESERDLIYRGTGIHHSVLSQSKYRKVLELMQSLCTSDLASDSSMYWESFTIETLEQTTIPDEMEVLFV